FYRQKIELPFFNFHLKGKGDWKPPKALIFETGTNRWREYLNWPPRATKALALYFQPRGRLTHQPPIQQADAFDEYLSDPARPVPCNERIDTRMVPESMSADQRFASRRPDVLVHETDALTKQVTLAGPITVELHVSTTGTDSDWIVKLIDVYPNDYPDVKFPSPPGRGAGDGSGVKMGGYQQLVRRDGRGGRTRHRFETPDHLKPGRWTAVNFTLPDVCHTFRPGHKIMVQIHSTWFPLVERNPQTFVDIARAKESDYRKATQ